ncbi:Gram-negative bacterial tonB protein [compost metagenome]
MRSKMLCSMILALSTVVSPIVFAADNQPLELGPAEALNYWKPSAAPFQPRMPASFGKVTFAEEVTVGYTVTKHGRTKDVQIIEAKPVGASTEWALNAVRAMRFEPTERNQARQPIRSQLSTRWNSSSTAEQP